MSAVQRYPNSQAQHSSFLLAKAVDPTNPTPTSPPIIPIAVAIIGVVVAIIVIAVIVYVRRYTVRHTRDTTLLLSV